MYLVCQGEKRKKICENKSGTDSISVARCETSGEWDNQVIPSDEAPIHYFLNNIGFEQPKYIGASLLWCGWFIPLTRCFTSGYRYGIRSGFSFPRLTRDSHFIMGLRVKPAMTASFKHSTEILPYFYISASKNGCKSIAAIVAK